MTCGVVCCAAWINDPISGVIGVENGPLYPEVSTCCLQMSCWEQDRDGDSARDSQGTAGVLGSEEEDQDDSAGVAAVAGHGVTAFTDFGIECLKQIIDDERAAGRAPNPICPAQ